MAYRSTRGKAKDAVSPHFLKSYAQSPVKSPKGSNVMESPASSPLKGPLTDVDLLTESPSFIAKSFYGLKKSKKSTENIKENVWTPKTPTKDKAQPLSRFGKSGCNVQLLKNARLNDKLLEKIANSPVKQAFLDTCSVEEFRRVYRSEIKQLEEDDKLSDRRITRGLSKIVTSRNDDEESVYSLHDSSEDEICFKISNRGFDAESVSDSSSVRSEENERTPTRRNVGALLISDSGVSSKAPSSGSLSESPRKRLKTEDNASLERSVSTPSSSERKFFKTKSVRDSLSTGTGNVVWGKGFNLRFVPGNQNQKGKHSKKSLGNVKKNSGISFPRKLRQPQEFSSGSTSTSQVSSQASVLNSSAQSVASGEMDVVEAEDEEVFMVKKNEIHKYGPASSPKTKVKSSIVDHSGGNVLTGESPQIPDSCEHEQGQNDDGSNTSPCDELAEAPASSRDSAKLFSIFKKSSPDKETQNVAKSRTPRKSNRKIPVPSPSDRTQLVIDAGQKKFGATQCDVCNMVYCHADPGDEASHAKFHRRLLEVLKYPGWKSERVVQEDPMECTRIVLVMSDDAKHLRKKVEDMYEVMGRDLGFAGDVAFKNPYHKVFLYISMDKKIEGCCVAESIKEGFRVIPGDLDQNEVSGQRPWCCLPMSEPALIGISRLWVSGQSRRQGVATKLVDSVRQWFDYGSLVPKHMVAFSDPTPDGRSFAQKYIGTPAFLVYKYQ